MEKLMFTKTNSNFGRKSTIVLAAFVTSLALSGCAKPAEGDGVNLPSSTAAADTQEQEISVLSPDGKYRLECLDMQDFSTGSGLYAYDTIRVVDTSSGETEWELGSSSWPPIAVWSPDSRYLALNQSGQKNSFVYVVDSNGWKSVEVPVPEDLPGSPDPNGIHCMEPDKWESDSVLRLTYRFNDSDGTDESSQNPVVAILFSADTAVSVPAGS